MAGSDFDENMRPKVVLAVMLLAALALTAAFYVQQRLTPLRPETPTEAEALPPPAAKAELAAASTPARRLMPAPTMSPVMAASPMTPEQEQEYIEGESSRLQSWSTKDDPASLMAILNDLTNSEKEVRLAAIEAVKQFGSREAIPALKADVAITTDTGEQIALLEAADFLSLPAISDLDAPVPKTPDQLQAEQQRRDREAARRQAQMQQRGQNQNPQPAPVGNPQAGAGN